MLAAGRRDEAKVALQRFQEESKKDSEQRLRFDLGQTDPTSRTLLEVQQAMDEGNSEMALGLLTFSSCPVGIGEQPNDSFASC